MGGARRADRRRHSARDDGVSADDAIARGATRALPASRAAGVDARLAHDEVGRRASPRLHRLPHPALHDGNDRPQRLTRDDRPPRRQGCLRQHRRELPNLVGHGVLPDRDGVPRPASVSRRVELDPDAGVREDGGESAAAAPRACRRRHRLARLHARSARRCRRLHQVTAAMELRSKTPSGPLVEKWSKHRFEMKLVNPANKRKYTVIVVGSGLAGGAAAASLSELGYNVRCYCYQDSPRRAHSIAAQGGINAAKNYQNDGDSIQRLFYDTIKGGDFRAREANVYRLAQVSVNIIDQCVAQGVPFAREYGGLLTNRSFGGAQVSRTFYARGQTGQQLLLGAYQALERQIGIGKVAMYARHEMLDLIVVDGRARGIVTRDLVTGQIESHAADAVVLGTGGYGNVYYLATYAKGA